MNGHSYGIFVRVIQIFFLLQFLGLGTFHFIILFFYMPLRSNFFFFDYDIQKNVNNNANVYYKRDDKITEKTKHKINLYDDRISYI